MRVGSQLVVMVTDNRGDPSWAPRRRSVVSVNRWSRPTPARFAASCAHCGEAFSTGTSITTKRGNGWCVAAHVLPATDVVDPLLPSLSEEDMRKPVGAKRAARNGQCKCCGAEYEHLQLIRFHKGVNGWVIDGHPIKTTDAPIMRRPIRVDEFRGIVPHVNLVDM